MKPFFEVVIGGGTLVLHDDRPREIITGSAALYHRINQSPRRFASRWEFETFTDPDHGKLFISIRVTPTALLIAPAAISTALLALSAVSPAFLPCGSS